MRHNPENFGELVAIAVMMLYEGLGWLAFAFYTVLWQMWQVTPEHWPFALRLMIYPVTAWAIGYVSRSLRQYL